MLPAKLADILHFPSDGKGQVTCAKQMFQYDSIREAVRGSSLGYHRPSSRVGKLRPFWVYYKPP